MKQGRRMERSEQEKKMPIDNRGKCSHRQIKPEQVNTLEPPSSPPITYASAVTASIPDRSSTKQSPGEVISPPSPKSTRADQSWEAT